MRLSWRTFFGPQSLAFMVGKVSLLSSPTYIGRSSQILMLFIAFHSWVSALQRSSYYCGKACSLFCDVHFLW